MKAVNVLSLAISVNSHTHISLATFPIICLLQNFRRHIVILKTMCIYKNLLQKWLHKFKLH